MAEPWVGAEGEITELLTAWQNGDEKAAEDLFQALYGELRRLAVRCFRSEPQGHTLQPSALVHEAFVRLIDQSRVRWQNRTHFFAIAARIMRRVLVDHARRRQLRHREDIQARSPLYRKLSPESFAQLAELDRGLRALAVDHPEHARVVELRYFGGLTRAEISTVLGISVPTVARRWRAARAWLFRYLTVEAAG